MFVQFVPLRSFQRKFELKSGFGTAEYLLYNSMDLNPGSPVIGPIMK
jgi:hypothetical protein